MNRAAFQKVLRLIKKDTQNEDMKEKFKGYTELELKLLNEFLSGQIKIITETKQKT
jgi:hypothetical protein